MQRTMLGGLALLLLATAAVLLYVGGDSSEQRMFVGMTMRCGLVFGALWLAHPQLDQLPKVLLGAVVVIALVIAVLAKTKGLIVLGLGVIGLLALLRVLKPRSASRQRTSRRDQKS